MLAKGYKEERKYTVYLIILLAAFAAVHMLKNSFMGLQEDEANWWMQIRHLEPGYFFHPPFIAYELFVITRIFGEGTLGLRMGSLIFTAGSLLLVNRICRELFGDRRRAFFTVLVVALLPITNFWLTLALQDSPFIFFSLLTALLTWKMLSTSRSGYWYGIGISAGITLLCKLQAGLFLFSFLLLLLASPENRRWLRRKEPYLALAIAVLLFLPTFIWYAQHNFEPVTYQAGNRIGFLENELWGYLAFVLEHIGKEMVALSPFVYLASIFGLIQGGRLAFSRRGERDQRFLLLFSMSAPTIIFFTLTGGPPNWAIPGHFVSLLTVAGALPPLLEHARHPLLQLHGRTLFVLLCFLLPPVLTVATLTLTVGDHVQNDYRALAGRLSEIRENMPEEDVCLASPYYFIPSEVSYYGGHIFGGYAILVNVYEHVVITAGGEGYSPWTPCEELVGKDIVFVDAEMNPDGYDTPLSFWVAKLAPYFENVEEPEVFSYRKWGNDERRYYIFACHAFRGSDPSMNHKGEVREYVTVETVGSCL